MENLEIDSESLITISFPLPYRVLVLAGLGILGWATNLHGLDHSGIDVISAMDLRTDTHSPRDTIPTHRSAGFRHAVASTVYVPVYRIFTAYSIWLFLSWSIFRLTTYRHPLLVDVFGYIPGVTALIILIILVCPLNIMYKNERDKFLQAVRRCLSPASEGSLYFSDIVFADIGTSFAKVFGDVWLSFWMLMPGNSILVPPIEQGWLRWVLPTVMSLPYFVRFRQCILEYNHQTNTSHRPLLNALKYATSFPVIYLSAAQRVLVNVSVKSLEGNEAISSAWYDRDYVFRLWLTAAAINSIYSFWWDLTNDWGLDLLRSKNAESESSGRPQTPRRLILLPHLNSASHLMTSRDSLNSRSSEDIDRPSRPSSPVYSSSHRRNYPYGLRSMLLFALPVYPLLIFLNLVLRMTWSVKLSSHLHSTRDGSFTIFWLEVAELLRRWLWVFLRVEWEVIKKVQEGGFKGRSDGFDGSEAHYELIPASPEPLLVPP